MKVAIVFCSLALTLCAVPASAVDLPEKFIGHFKLDHSENLDDYLVAKGFGWLMRKVINFATVTKVFSHGSEPSRYRFKNLTSKKNTDYKNFALGEEFQAESLDSTQHKITFLYDPSADTVTEHHVPLDPSEKAEDFVYSIDGDFLVMELNFGGVSATRYYKRQ
uniref:FABP domain-containing protein n=1 Tax=Steinernema glaseri TaxID=37863 RepID=A0A1I7ZFP0_9BILA